MKISNRRSWIMLTTLSLAATSAALAQESSLKWKDLSWTEAQGVIRDLGARVVDDARTTATLTGFIFKSCKDHVSVVVENRNFRIRGSNALRACLTQAEKDHPNANLGDEDVYLRISDSHFPKMTGLDSHDGEVRLISKNTNVDPAREEYTSFSPALRFVSRHTIASNEYADRLAKEDRRLEQLLEQAKNCRDSVKNNELALAAIEELLASDKLDSDEAEALTKSVGNSERRILEKRLADLKPSEIVELENLNDDIRSWQERYSGFEASAGIGARLRMSVAGKLASNSGSSRAARAAKQVFDEIGESKSVPADVKNTAQLNAYDMRGNLVAAELSEYIRSQALSGMNPAYVMQGLQEHGAYLSYKSAIEEEIKEACGSFGLYQTYTQTGRESFQRCAELRQRAQIQQTRIASLLHQEMAKVQLEQFELMRRQQQGPAIGQVSAPVAPQAAPAPKMDL